MSEMLKTPVTGRRASLPPPEPQRPRIARSLLDRRKWTVTSLVLDVVLLALAGLIVYGAADAAGVPREGRWIIWLLPPIVVALLALRRLYRSSLHIRLLDVAGHVVSAMSIAVMLVIALNAVFEATEEPARLLARMWLFGTLSVIGGRIVLALTLRRARVHRLVGERTLILGAGRVATQVERRLDSQPELGLNPVGFVETEPLPEKLAPGRRGPILGRLDEFEDIVAECGVRHVLVAFMGPGVSDTEVLSAVGRAQRIGVKVSLVPRLFEAINDQMRLEHIGGMPLLHLRALDPAGWQFTVKDAFDRVIAAVGLLALLPLLTVTALAVRLTSPGPIFLRQRRVGRDGQPFDLLKFRSMRMPATGSEESSGAPLVAVPPGDLGPGGVEGIDRRTRLGKLLRRTSLDELPQLFNVLRGEMSLVGPRPERPEFVELFEHSIHRYDDRHRVKAGITGWAQVHHLRGKTSLADRIEWDNYYIDNWSLRLDFKILLLTVSAVFHGAE